MKLKKDQISNIIWLVLILLLLFTPVGFHTRVFLGRLFSFSPDMVKTEERKKIEDYNWVIEDLEGNKINFREFENKVVLVNFWATWCPPCIAEMPSLVELHKTYGDKVVFVFLAHDEQEKVSAYLEKKGYRLPVYFERTRTPESIDSNSLPTTYIIDVNGEVIVSEKGTADWNSGKTQQILDGLLNTRA